MDAGAARAQLRLTADKIWNAADPGLNPLEVAIPALVANGIYQASATCAVPVGLSPGEYFLGAQLRPAGTPGTINPANSLALSAMKLTIVGTGGPISLTPATLTPPAGASSASIGIANLGGGTLSWTATISGTPWLRFADGTSSRTGTGAGSLVVICDANASAMARNVTIAVSAPGDNPASQQVAVTQSGTAPSPPPVTYFQFSTVSPVQTVNVSFPVTINAMNGTVQPDQLQAAFQGDVELRAQSGGNVSLGYVPLVNGTWSGLLSLDTASLQTALIGSTTVGGKLVEPRRH